MSLVEWANVAGVAFFAGMVVLFVTLMFVHEPTRFRRMLATGVVVVVGSAAIFYWLLQRSFIDRPAP